MADFVFDPRVFYTYNQLQGDVGLSITDPLFSRSRESLSSLRPVEPRDSRTPPAVWEERLDSASLPYSRTGDDRDRGDTALSSAEIAVSRRSRRAAASRASLWAARRDPRGT